MLSLEVLVFKFTLICTTKRCFHRIDAWNLKFTPHGNSCSWLFAKIVWESWVFKAKVVAQLGHQVREEPSLMRHFLEVVSIHKYVLFAAVPVQIAIKNDFSFLFELSNQAFNGKIFRVQGLKWVLPSAVKVLADEGTPIISIDDSVGIKHWHNFEHKVVSEDFCLGRVRCQEIYDTLHCPAAVRFTRVHSSRQKYAFFAQCLFAFRIFVLRSNRYKITSVASQGSGQHRAMEEILTVRLLFDLVHVLTQITVCIWETVSKIHTIVIAVKRVGESKCIVFFVGETVAVHLVSNVVLVVTNIAANSVPSCLFLLIQILTVGEHSHSLVVETVRFRQINYIKTDFLAFFCVRNSKEVPLSMTVGIDIILQH